LEKAIDIKRRAQRCLQAGDLDGALTEYEKLTRAAECEPIHFVLMADLLFKKGDRDEAARRYRESVDAYAATGLYKNAIAVCKKMARLALSPGVVLQRLAELHALDGLATEASLYYQEYAEHQARARRFREAAAAMRQAFATLPEQVRVLERAAEWLSLAGDEPGAAAVLQEAAQHAAERGLAEDSVRLRAQAEALQPGAQPPSDAVPPLEEPLPDEPAVPEEAEPDLLADAPAPASNVWESSPEECAEPHAEPSPAERVESVEEPESPPRFVVPEPTEVAAPDVGADVAPPPPGGLRFDATPPATENGGESELNRIEGLLRVAAERFRSGEGDAAGEALVEAAQGYEALGRLERSAAIYRSLGRSPHATPEVLGLWLRNCELRGAREEAAEVACGLGDRALNEGDEEGGREWFTRALRHMPDHELARRRMERLGQRPAVAEAAPPTPELPPGGGDGRVEVAVGRAQAVTLDLGSLITEFQRGLQSQLSGDSQSHYDLGMTYREMGMLEQATECFREAARDPAFRARSAEMVGRCLLDEGRFEDAIAEFTGALDAVGPSAEAGVCLRFHLGLAYEVAGRAGEALAEFERVYAAQPNYPDVAQKIRLLRQTLERV